MLNWRGVTRWLPFTTSHGAKMAGPTDPIEYPETRKYKHFASEQATNILTALSAAKSSVEAEMLHHKSNEALDALKKLLSHIDKSVILFTVSQEAKNE